MGRYGYGEGRYGRARSGKKGKREISPLFWERANAVGPANEWHYYYIITAS